MGVVYCDFVLLLGLVNFPLYIGQKLSLIPFEILIDVYIVSLVMSDFTEAIHVQLSNKGAEVVMLEEFWQHNVSKSIYVLNIKSIA